jgi:uncharacterized protein YkwD
VHPDDRPQGRWRGRHRHPRRAFGPLGLAIVVAVILGGFAAGAAFLPAGFVGRPGDSRAVVGGLAGGASAETDAAQEARAATKIMKAPPAASPSKSPTAKPNPRPKDTGTSPTPRRSPTAGGAATGAATGAGGTQQAQVVVMVNRQRAAGGCGPLSANARLTVAAQLHSADQAAHDTMSHTGSDGSSPWDRTRRAGYPNAIAENVAAGYRDAEAVMQGWMNSPGHRANIMNCAARAIGVGYAKAADGTPYWTQDFGSTV